MPSRQHAVANAQANRLGWPNQELEYGRHSAAVSDVLAQQEMSVLFCDLRDFSSLVESSQELSGVFQRVNAALHVMLSEIENGEGTVSDFQGDSVLGFWTRAQTFLPEPVAACRAAVAILDVFRKANAEPETSILKGFMPSIGISSGSGLTGPMGVGHLRKEGVFGQPVNLASRLQGLSKQLGVSALVDEATAESVQQFARGSSLTFRRCGRFLLPGLSEPVDVHQLSTSSEECGQTAHQKECYERAVQDFTGGHWAQSRLLLSEVPEGDSIRDFLLTCMDEHGNEVPPNWDGAITIGSK